MWDSLRHKARLNILDYSRIAACLSASAVSSNACLSSLLPLGKHFYQNITRCCLWTDTYTQMKVNSCHIQVNSREVTIFRKHYTPRFMNPDNLTPCTHITHSSQDQDLRIYESISVWGPVCDNGLPISSVPNLPTPKNLNLQFGVSPHLSVWLEQHPGAVSQSEARLGSCWPMRGWGLVLCDVMWAIRAASVITGMSWHWPGAGGSQGWYQDRSDNR